MKFRIINQKLLLERSEKSKVIRTGLRNIQKGISNFLDNLAKVFDVSNINEVRMIAGDIMEQALDGVFGYPDKEKGAGKFKVEGLLKDFVKWMKDNNRIEHIDDAYIRAARTTPWKYPEIDLLVNFFPYEETEKGLTLFKKGERVSDILSNVSDFEGGDNPKLHQWISNEGLQKVDELITGLDIEGYNYMVKLEKMEFLNRFINIFLKFTKENVDEIWKYVNISGDAGYWYIFKSFWKYLYKTAYSKRDVKESKDYNTYLYNELKKFGIDEEKIKHYLSFPIEKIQYVINDVLKNPKKYYEKYGKSLEQKEEELEVAKDENLEAKKLLRGVRNGN